MGLKSKPYKISWEDTLPVDIEGVNVQLRKQFKDIDDMFQQIYTSSVEADQTLDSTTTTTANTALQFINILDYGGNPDGITDNTYAINEALEDVPETGGIIYFPPGVYYTSTGMRLTINNTVIRGSGPATTTIKSDNEDDDPLIEEPGVILVQAERCSIEDIGIEFSGTGCSAIIANNGEIYPDLGASRLRVQNVKIKGTGALTGHGIWMVNSHHGYIADLYMPGGGGNAIYLQSAGFNTFVDIHITVNIGEEGVAISPQWAVGVLLAKQDGQDVMDGLLQADDNRFFNLITEGVTYGIYFDTLLESFPPARNSFYGGASEGNVTANVFINNGENNTFYGYHTESTPNDIYIVGNDGNHSNKFYGCIGTIQIEDPPSAQGIQATVIGGHNGNVIIDGPNVFGTQIYGMSGTTLTDAGTNTLSFQSTLNTPPNAVTVYKFNGRTFTAGPTTSTSIQGSGGSIVTLVALPASSYGTVHVLGKQSGTTNVAYYRVDYVNGTGIDIEVSTPPAAGSNAAQLDFSLSSSNLQARGKNATAPDAVIYTLDYWPL